MSVGICIVRLLLHRQIRHHRQPGYRTVKQLASLTLHIDCTTYKLGLARMLGSAAEGDIVEVWAARKEPRRIKCYGMLRCRAGKVLYPETSKFGQFCIML